MKVVFVSGMLPNGHYSQYITSGLAINPNIELIVYSDRSPKNLEIIGSGKIKPVWSNSWKFVFEILKELIGDKPDVVHFQHEFNMYGGQITAILFPILLFLTRLCGFKVITTVHAVVPLGQVNERFVEIFGYDPKKVHPSLVKVFFGFIFFTITRISNECIVHTNLTKKVLISDYLASKSKIHVIPIAIPDRETSKAVKEHYFFYFGYMVRRKGLGLAIDGFKKFIEKDSDTDFRLILAGGVIKGQEWAFEEIKNMVAKYNLGDKIEIRGFIEQEEQDRLYEKAYAVVIPAILSIASSGPLFHANGYHKCVLVSKIGHFLEDIDNMKTGVLVENDKWDETFEWAVNNPGTVLAIEQNVAKKAASLSPKLTASKYLEIYK